MPKRRMTAARKRQLAKFQLAGVRARQHSFSNPIKPGTNWPKPHGEWGRERRHKLGGKAYQKKSGGFTIDPALAAILGHS